MRSRASIIGILAVLAFAGSYLGRGLLQRKISLPSVASRPFGRTEYRRIVSLAPSATEMLCALGLGDRLVGVTRFCDYPPEVRTLPKVGGYFDPNYEAIVTLGPDLVVMLAEHRDAEQHFAALRLATLPVNHKTVEGILESAILIGRAGGVEAKAEALVADIRARMQRLHRKTQGLDRPKVLICAGRSMGSGSLDDVCVAGNEGFYGPMLELAGGDNAYGGFLRFPTVSAEGILQMNPDVIVDLVADLEKQGLTEQSVMEEWQRIPKVNATRTGRLYVFGEQYVALPGPRFILIAEKLARVLHPEVAWDEP